MGSKKVRNERQLERMRTNPVAPPVEKKTEPAGFELPTGKPQRQWYTLGFMIVSILLIMFAVNWVINYAFTAVCLSRDPSLKDNSEALMEAFNKFVGSNAAYMILQKMSLNISVVLTLLLFFKRFEGENISSLGIHFKGKTGVNIGAGALLGFVAILLAYNLLMIIGAVKMTGRVYFDPIQLLWTLDMIITVLADEALFRGYVRYKLADKHKILIYAASAIVFALYKGLPSTSPVTYISYGAMALFMMYIYELTKSLWFGIMFRFAWAFFSGIVLSINLSTIPGIFMNEGLKESIFAGNDFGFENGLIAVIVIVVCFGIVKYIFEGRMKPGKKFQRRLQKDGTIR